MSKFAESDVEESALYYFEELGYTILHGPEIAPGEPNPSLVRLRGDFFTISQSL